MDLLIISKVIKKNVFLINDDVGIAVVVSRIPFCGSAVGLSRFARTLFANFRVLCVSQKQEFS